MYEANTSKIVAQNIKTLFGGGQIDQFRFLNQRADPIYARAFLDFSFNGADEFFHFLHVDNACIDGLASGRLFIKPRNIHITIGRKG